MAGAMPKKVMLTSTLMHQEPAFEHMNPYLCVSANGQSLQALPALLDHFWELPSKKDPPVCEYSR
jgi:hypothetical protein